MEKQTNMAAEGRVKESTQPVRDYGNEPYFVRKADKSKAFLEKHGFPKELIKKNV